MGKLKAPLLSLGARGTIGDAITYQKRGQVAFARTKPIPQYRRSLAQNYQRWDYEDAIFFWNSRTDAQKAIYRTAGAKLHLTAFAYAIRHYLRNLPDLAGRWHLDTISGAIQPDSSKNSNDGTVFGATAATGRIDGCLFFDGINDYVNFGTDPSLNILQPFTLEFFIKPQVEANDQALVTRLAALGGIIQQLFVIRIGGIDHYGYYNVPNGWEEFLTALVSYNEWQHIAYAYDGTNMRVLKDSVPTAPQLVTAPVSQPTYHTYLGGGWVGIARPEADFDEVRWYTRLLSDAQIKAHSERRYPV